MKIEKGDRIRFLNEVGGGTVTRIEGSLVFVEDEDGFEVPISASEVVVIEKAGGAGNASGCKDAAPYCSYLISWLGEDGYMHALHQGLIEPNTKLPLDEQLARELDVTYDIQLILFKKGKPYPAVAPVSTSLSNKARRFYKENSFRANDFFYQPAVLFSIIKNELEKKMDLLTEKETKAIILEKEGGDAAPPKAKRKSTPELLEVDLHIHELIDSVVGLSNGEMLQIQMDRFHVVMDENKNAKGRRIVFIHGVGNGILKTEIRKQLDRKYKGINYQDASFREYGYGATMVIV
ncbi:MAG: DUF2027 domain-containing protein [Bacteroidales bacterium]|nr:DUF2027 domain-containing protein [Bacteroidales bacterium]